MAINSRFDQFKYISIQRFSIYLSLIIGCLFLLIAGISSKFNSLYSLISGALMFTGCCYFLFYYSLNKLLYKRVKLIYKLISETKFDESMPGQTDQNDNLNLNKVENDVQQWITKRNFELDQLRQLEKYRKDYIGNVSHELKTPVFNIQGYLQTLLDGKIEDQAIKKQFLSKAYKNALRLQHIIDDLNIVDKLESGEQILDFQKLSIKNMIREAFEENSELAALKNIKLQFNSEAADEFWVNADKEHIQIVLSNLINNSIKYGKTNGYSKAGLYELENVILIEISDNGIGIGEDHLKHVFDRFYRADKSRSREQGGSGIGLSIVKHIIENHNQKIFVRSKEGFGTTFGFTLEKSK